MAKKLFALALVVIMLFTLVGCGKKKREIVKLTLSTEDSEAILAAAGITLPDAETTAAAGSIVKWFSWYDGFHNYSDDEVINTGFWTFQEKYGCDVEWIECTYDSYSDDLANLILAGTSPDFTHSGSGVYPGLTLQGFFAPVNDYIDYDDALWASVKDFVYDYCAIGDKVYAMCTDIAFGQVVAYNRRVMDEWGFDDPAELYYNDEWTWDVFYEMCLDFSDPDEDRYALDGWSFTSGIMDSSGAELVYYNTETDLFETNVDDPRLERAASVLYDLAKNECVFPWWNNGWSLRNGVEGGGIKEGLCLFHIRGTYVFTGPVEDISNVWGDVAEGELMFCPVPRDPNGDGKYYINCSPNGYALIKGGENHEGAALLAACDRFKILDPTVISIDRRNLEEVYLWTDEMLQMWDICYEIANNSDGVIFSYNFGDRINSYVSNFYDSAHGAEASTWAQLKEANQEALDYYVAELNVTIQEFIDKEA
ncbi:MAG: carbohydrate ABC transporter substrate-binding protein [Oscillospiraceae bacterium]|nr:carbohydrate ABC transporter substrate-binding protein [Oscillospiraceae bacterium]